MVAITDEESARAWLGTQPHQVQVWFAARCALRALPCVGFADSEKVESLANVSFRALLVAVAAGTCRASDMKDLATTNRSAADDAHPTAAAAYSILSRAYSAARSAADSALSAADPAESFLSAARSIGYSGDALARYSAATYAAASNDAENSLAWPRLWHDADMPEGLDEGWDWLRAHLAADPEKWGFWLEWYEAILNGQPLPWELSFRIATTLTDKDWDKGAAHVAERIAEIRRAFDVADAVSDLRGATETVAADGLRVHRGHNNPPELIEDSKLAERTTIVWAALDELEREAKAETPDKTKAQAALAVIREWFLSACAYLGRKADLAIDTAIRWAIPTIGGGYFLLNPDKLQKLINLAEHWLRP